MFSSRYFSPRYFASRYFATGVSGGGSSFTGDATVTAPAGAFDAVGLAFGGIAATAYKVEAYLSGAWVDLSADVMAGSVNLQYGVSGDGPLDCVATSGELRFTLRNDADNSGGILGWYSPAAAVKRAGWSFGVPVRVKVTSGLYADIVRFYGKIRVISPFAGTNRERRVDVVAYDVMADLAETNAREATIQLSQSEDDLLTAVLAALPSESQPLAVDFDAGVDTFPVAFDDIKGDVKALKLMRDVVLSSFGLLACNGDGTLRYRSRNALSIETSLFDFSDDMTSLSVPSSLDKTFSRARATTHPKTVSATATDVLYLAPSVITVAAATTLEPWTNYTDPNDRQTPVGGTAVVTALVANTHYAANSAADGSGTDRSGAISISIDAFSSTAKWTITNPTGSPIYITLLKVVGKAIRDTGAQTFESVVAGGTADRPIEFDLPYQNDPYVGQSAVDFVTLVYASLTQQIDAMEFHANKSDDFMAAALTLEPGDRITVSEAVTGVSSVVCVVRSVSLQFKPNAQIFCRLGLTPASVLATWALGSAGYSELGDTTYIGI